MTKQLETIVKDMANNIDLSSIDPSSFTSDDSTNFEDNPTPQFSACLLYTSFRLSPPAVRVFAAAVRRK